ncbi:MAG: hypothetical protein AB7S26_25570 [Sandaracinaceae bacterium]
MTPVAVPVGRGAIALTALCALVGCGRAFIDARPARTMWGNASGTTWVTGEPRRIAFATEDRAAFGLGEGDATGTVEVPEPVAEIVAGANEGDGLLVLGARGGVFEPERSSSRLRRVVLPGPALAAAAWTRRCAVVRGDGTYCWDAGAAPVRLPGSTSEDAYVMVDASRVCALDRSGTLRCWEGDEGYLERDPASEVTEVHAASDGAHGLCVIHGIERDLLCFRGRRRVALPYPTAYADHVTSVDQDAHTLCWIAGDALYCYGEGDATHGWAQVGPRGIAAGSVPPDVESHLRFRAPQRVMEVTRGAQVLLANGALCVSSPPATQLACSGFTDERDALTARLPTGDARFLDRMDPPLVASPCAEVAE